MTQPLEPLRMLSALRSHGVTFVLVGGTAMAARGGPIDFDAVEICIPEDRQNLKRVSLALQQLGAIPVGPDEADRSSYETIDGPLDVIELRDGFAELSERGSNEDLGNGVVARVASMSDLTDMARSSGDLSGAMTLATLVAVDEPVSTGHEDEFGPTREPRSGPRWLDGLMVKFEHVDDFLTRTLYGDETQIRS